MFRSVSSDAAPISPVLRYDGDSCHAPLSCLGFAIPTRLPAQAGSRCGPIGWHPHHRPAAAIGLTDGPRHQTVRSPENQLSNKKRPARSGGPERTISILNVHPRPDGRKPKCNQTSRALVRAPVAGRRIMVLGGPGAPPGAWLAGEGRTAPDLADQRPRDRPSGGPVS